MGPLGIYVALPGRVSGILSQECRPDVAGSFDFSKDAGNLDLYVKSSLTQMTQIKKQTKTMYDRGWQDI